jgi:hypothetical protein
MAHLNELDVDTLKRLYLEEMLTETEIAKRYGTYQVMIGRMRERWGIPTLGKTGRITAKLPLLTPLQEELLLGSLMGDGTMVRGGKDTAFYVEDHSLAQEDYLKWKVDLLGPFVTRTYPTIKRVGEKEYHGIAFRTCSCVHLKPWFDAFYTTGKRQFPGLIVRRMTPFSLAVWFMDDGSLLRDFHPRISFGLDETSMMRSVRALRKLGLKPEWHVDEDGNGEFTFPGQSDQFYDLVRPHIPECMSYKLPKESLRRDLDRNAKELTSERASTLYEGGMSLMDIASLFKVGTSTVRRRLDNLGKARRKMGRPRRSYSVEAATISLGNIDPTKWSKLSSDEQEQWVDHVYGVLSCTPFPFPVSVKTPLEEFHGLTKHLSTIREGVLSRSHVGLRMCYPFFPNRYKESSPYAPSREGRPP